MQVSFLHVLHVLFKYSFYLALLYVIVKVCMVMRSENRLFSTLLELVQLLLGKRLSMVSTSNTPHILCFSFFFLNSIGTQ